MGIAHFPARHDVHDHRMLNVIIYVLSTYVITVIIHIAVGKFLIEVSFLDASVSQLGSVTVYRIRSTTMLHMCYTYCCVCELFVCTAHYS